MKLTCYIIDDEPLAIEVLQAHLEKIERIELAGTFQNAVKAFEALHENPVDLVFLDIQMPRLTGIKLLQSLSKPPRVIFTTAYREYALEGFELNVTDYLLKPISFERFLKAVNKIFDSEFIPAGAVNNPGISNNESLSVFIQTGSKKVKVNLEKVLFIESRRDYVTIKTTDKEISTLQTITYMENSLPEGHFLRVHRSFIVNLNRIEGWSSNDIELPGLEIPIGRTYKNAVLKVLEKRSNIL